MIFFSNLKEKENFRSVYTLFFSLFLWVSLGFCLFGGDFVFWGFLFDFFFLGFFWLFF